MYPFSPKQGKRSLILWSVSAFPEPCFWAVNFTGALSFQVGQVDEKRLKFPSCQVSCTCTYLLSHVRLPARLFCPWNFLAKNTGEGCHFLLKGIFPTPESNPHFLCLLHCQVDSLPLRHLGENGYMYMYGWVPLLCTWNYHNIINWLYSNEKKSKSKVSTFFHVKKKPH